jgi:hypothetical protein
VLSAPLLCSPSERAVPVENGGRGLDPPQGSAEPLELPAGGEPVTNDARTQGFVGQVLHPVRGVGPNRRAVIVQYAQYGWVRGDHFNRSEQLVTRQRARESFENFFSAGLVSVIRTTKWIKHMRVKRRNESGRIYLIQPPDSALMWEKQHTVVDPNGRCQLLSKAVARRAPDERRRWGLKKNRKK